MSSAEIFLQKTREGYHYLAACQNEYCPQQPQGTEGFGCKKGQLSSQPLISYASLTDLVTTKESPQSLKIKLFEGTIFNMSIFSQGNTKEYLVHVVVVLYLINKKGRSMQCRKLAKAVDKLAGNLDNLQRPTGPKGATYKDNQESCKVEIMHTQQMLQEAQKAHNKAIAKTYKLLRNVLSGDHSPNGIGFAARCTSMTCGLE
jgi:hypothetical protein